jgi:hypothetical protein
MAKSKNTKFKIETTQSWISQFKRPTRIKIKFERPTLDQLVKDLK